MRVGLPKDQVYRLSISPKEYFYRVKKQNSVVKIDFFSLIQNYLDGVILQCAPSMTSWVNPHPFIELIHALRFESIHTLLSRSTPFWEEGCGSTQDVIDGPHCTLQDFFHITNFYLTFFKISPKTSHLIKAMKSSPLLRPFCVSAFWVFYLLNI